MKNRKTALITGGTSGIGFELAKLFAKDGYNLFIVARSAQELEETKNTLEKDFEISVETIAHDLFDPKNAYSVYNELKSKHARVDVLVNNAGHGHYAEFIDSDLEMDLNIINLNISSLVILTKLIATEMVERGEGKILNLSSIAGKSPGPYQSVYHGTKAFVQSFTEALRYELKDKGITVTALLPGATDTDFFKKAGMMKSKIVQDPSNLADPADVAKDGYEALMADKDMVVSGLKNKLQVGLGHLSSDEANAKKMAKQQEPVDHKK